MGPRLFRRGNRNIPDDFSHSFQASMGPRLFRRGNVEWFWYGHKASSCFNGATSFQTWKYQATDSVETSTGRASMGPRLFRRGNGRKMTNHVHVSSCFNGATSFQTWKCGDPLTQGVGTGGFNGATSFQTWKCSSRPHVGRIGAELQWGHVFSDVEISGPRFTGR